MRFALQLGRLIFRIGIDVRNDNLAAILAVSTRTARPDGRFEGNARQVAKPMMHVKPNVGNEKQVTMS